jgi:hypothetical protein
MHPPPLPPHPLPRRASVRRGLAWTVALGLVAACVVVACNDNNGPTGPEPLDPQLVAQGMTIFRYNTFGDESFWTDTLHMNEVIETAVDPTTALSVGLKVDSDSLPAAVVQGIQNGSISLTDPATTVALLKLNAVVGVKGNVQTVNGKDTLVSVGITCALCHSTVDNSFAPGIGKRLDGWPNRDLNPGAIIALSPALTADQKAVYNSWGAGKYDPRYNFDGKNGPQVIPPAYGLNGLHSITATAMGRTLRTGTGTSASRRCTDTEHSTSRAPACTSTIRPTSSRRSFRHCRSTSSVSQRRHRQPGASIPRRRRAASRCSTGRADARRVTQGHC